MINIFKYNGDSQLYQALQRNFADAKVHFFREIRKLPRDNDFVMRCWMTNFIFTDGTRKPQCIGAEMGIRPALWVS